MRKRGNVTLYVVFLLLALVIVIIGAVVAPLGVLFSTQMFEAGEGIMLRANESLSSIQNDDIRESMYDAINSGYENADNNVEVMSAIFKWSWVIVLGLVGLVLFLYSRQLAEYGRGGLVG